MAKAKKKDSEKESESVEEVQMGEPLTSELIEPEKEVVYDKVGKDLSQHPKFSKFKGEK